MQPSAAVLELGKGRHQRELARDAAVEVVERREPHPGPSAVQLAAPLLLANPQKRPQSSPCPRSRPGPEDAPRRPSRGGQPGLADWKDVRYERRPRTPLELRCERPGEGQDVRHDDARVDLPDEPSGLRRGSDRGGIRLGAGARGSGRPGTGRRREVYPPARRVLASGSTSRGGPRGRAPPARARGRSRETRGRDRRRRRGEPEPRRRAPETEGAVRRSRRARAPSASGVRDRRRP